MYFRILGYHKMIQRMIVKGICVAHFFLFYVFISTADSAPDSGCNSADDSVSSSDSVVLSDSAASSKFDLGTPEDAWCLLTRSYNHPFVEYLACLAYSTRSFYLPDTTVIVMCICVS